MWIVSFALPSFIVKQAGGGQLLAFQPTKFDCFLNNNYALLVYFLKNVNFPLKKDSKFNPFCFYNLTLVLVSRNVGSKNKGWTHQTDSSLKNVKPKT